jgi:hypothetical protein
MRGAVVGAAVVITGKTNVCPGKKRQGHVTGRLNESKICYPGPCLQFTKETRALDQQTSEVDVAGLGDPELRIAVTGLTASRSQAEIAAYITTLLEAFLAA